MTIDRLRPVWPNARWLIVTTKAQEEPIRACLPRHMRRCLLVEPEGKNTAACITLSAMSLAVREPSRVMVVVPADHWIDRIGVFQKTMRVAIRAAVEHDTIVTIGVRPTHAHPGLGYLCAGKTNGLGIPRLLRLRRFIEKPSLAMARKLVKQPMTYWNSGMFVGTADKFLECVTEWLPEHTRRLIPFAKHAKRFCAPSSRARVYRHLKAVSFDQGVMGYLKGGLIVEGRFGWEDLGSWDVWAKRSHAQASVVSMDSRNVTVISQERHLVATIGVGNLLIVHTPNVTLICPPERSQAVRAMVKRVLRAPHLAKWR
jgi:mannose-1-phosphate guanylyltransferase